MITRESITIMLGGDSFSLAEAAWRTGLTFTNPVERSQIGVRSGSMGLPEPRGHPNLGAPDAAPEDGKWSALLDTILPHADALRQLGVEAMVVYAGYFYEAQCNLTFWPDAMGKLGQLGVPLWVSCYGDDGDPSTVENPADRPRGLAFRTLDQRRRNLRSAPPSASLLGA